MTDETLRGQIGGTGGTGGLGGSGGGGGGGVGVGGEAPWLPALADLRRYFEALRSSDQRALDMASDERVKAAHALAEEQRRALTIAQEEREKAAQALSARIDRAIADNFARLSDRLTAYEFQITGLLAEKDRAVELATGEREKAAGVLRKTELRADETAEREREKAAAELRVGLDRSIGEGDDRLREHIENQVAQINAALASADKLQSVRIEAVRGQLTDSMAAAAAAINKAEIATEKRLEGMNEFRQQLADQTASFMPREVADAQFNEIRRAMSELTEKVGKIT